ncbi:MAG: amino acid adenylation domain-containing protein [Gammaproteobacteria bacterium]|jgi:amino acid adenylation domain-containing protein/non-ribosomal peptide synthase protein (TIGR01720 family)|nr:amino acid adenylation domain-containing protein [Gammaproteobacteria bacterium]
MSTTELLEQLRAAEITLAVADGRLSVSAPKGRLTPELRAALTANKAELIELLQDSAGAATATAAPLQRADRSRPLPLSHAQQRIWFLEELEGGSAVYNIPWAVRIRGPLQPDALQQALSELQQRHESLRTTFADTPAGPRQQINAGGDLQIERLRLPAASDAEVKAQVSAWAGRRFNLRRGPLLHAGLIESGRDDWVLVLVIHHIVMDGWSLEILQRELFALYASHTGGGPANLPELPLQLADYAAWQREQIAHGAFADQVRYWQRQLSGAPALLDLPTDRPRPAEQSYRGARLRRLLPGDLSRDLLEFAGDRGVTLFMVLLATYQVLLARYSGQPDVVVGTPIAGRQRSELEGLVGLFLNTLAMRSDLGSDPAFGELLARVQASCLEAYANQDMPFDRIVEALDTPRNLSHPPVFQVQFVLQNAARAGVVTGGLTFAAVDFDYGTAKFDLTLAAAEMPDGLAVEFEYCSDLFSEATIAQLAQSFEVLLRAGITHPELPVSRLPLLTPAERSASLARLRGPTVSYPREATVHGLFEQQVQRTPAAAALVCDDVTLSYAELNARANQLAHWLRRRGVGSGDRVGVCLLRSTELVVSLLGTLKAGAAYVPLDPDYPAQRLLHMLEDADVGLVLSSTALQDQLPAHAASVVALETFAAELQTQASTNPAPAAAADDLAYIIFTSGSTGRPKGVMNAHHGICNRLLWMQDEYRLAAGDRVLQKTPFSFDVSVWEFFWPLQTGATLVVARPDGHKDTGYLCATIRAHNITTVHFVPTMLQVFLEDPQAALCRSLRRVICSGEALPHELQTRFYLTLDAELHNLYGPTEAAVDVTHWACPRDSRDPVVPIGRPVANTPLYVVEPNGEPAPARVAGELWIGGVQVARGYAGRPDLTAERFIPDPFAVDPEARIYRTGDRVRLRHDGALEFLGRLDQQVKLRGLRIELGEIEAALDRQPGVIQSVVMLRTEIAGAPQLVAYLTCSGEQPAADELRAALALHLPDYMLPAAFVGLDAFPLLPSGKVDRAALPAPAAPQATSTHYVPPGTPAETTLAAIWSELLRVERVGIHDNFFELGGDSILSIQIITRAARAGLRLQPKQLFRYQTIAELATVAETATRVVAEQGLVTGTVPLTPIQHWLLDGAATDLHHFNQSIRLTVNQPLTVAVVERALQALVAHHDALRLEFRCTDGAWTQTFADPTPPRVRVLPLEGVAGDAPEAAIIAAADELQAGFDIARAPLLQALLVTRNTAVSELIIVIHHLVMDGLSWRILLEDLAAACTRLSAGQPPELPPKTSSLQAWSRRLRDYAASAELRAEARYWREQRWERCAPVPLDHPRGDNRVGTTATAHVRLSVAATEQLLTQAAGAFRTQINDLLLAAFARAWQRWSGQAEVLLDLEGHGREAIIDAVDITRTVGWFTTLYPVALHADYPAWDQLIKATKEQLRNIPHRGLGFGVLRYLTDTDLAAVGRPQIVFNYLGQFDQSFSADGLFSMASGGRGAEQSPGRPRAHVLEINGGVYGGELQINVNYSRELHTAASAERLADCYQQTLVELIRYCADPSHRGATPTDFPLARLSQDSVDKLLRAYPDATDIYPVTPLQHGMLFQSQLSAATEERFSDVYLTQVIWTLAGELDTAAFATAWQQVTARHASLRTGFALTGNAGPLAIVRGGVRPALSMADWRSLDSGAQEVALETLLEDDRRRSFAFTEAPLMRLYLGRCDDDRYRFVWSHHHIIMDGWSIPVVLAEVFTVYAALTRGHTPQLPPAHSYRHYLEWLAQQDPSAAEAHWRGVLADFTAATPLPGAHLPASESGTPSYAKQFATLDAATTTQLRDCARQLRITLNSLFQGLWALVLSRYSGATDVLFGATTSGRPADLAHVEQIVGLFLNTLPCRVKVESTRRVDEWLAEIQTAQLAARQHEHAALTDMHNWSGVARGQDLFRTLLVFENYPDAESLVADRADLRILDMQARGWTSFPLSVAVSAGEQLVLRIAYDTRLFTAARVEQIGAYLGQLAQAVVRQPTATVTELLQLSPPPCSAAPARTPAPAQLDTTAQPNVVELFEAQVSARPAAEAVAGWDDTQAAGAWSYAELNDRANRIAHALLELGLPANSRIGLLQDHDAPMIAAILGTLKAGHAYVPLDPLSPQRRLEQIAADTGLAALLHAPRHAAAAAALSNRPLEVSAKAPAAPLANPGVRVADDALAYILTTSGSTGRPKGVMQTRRNMTHLMLNYAAAIRINADDRLSLFSTYGFDAAVMDIFGALVRGATVCPIDIRRTASAAAVRAALCNLRVNVFHATPTVYRYLVSAADDAQLPHVRAVVLGGEAARPSDLQAFKRCFSRGALFVNGLGLTESTLVLQYFADHDTPVPADALPVGTPVADTEVVLLDEHGQPAAVAGEIAIHSPWLTPGYWNAPEATAAAFFTDSNGRRFYRSGDLARYTADGELVYRGRRDAQLKVRGHRIEPGDIAHALNTATAVSDSAVALMQDAGGEQRLTAYVVPAPDQAFEPAFLREWLAARLPDYMVPAAFVAMEALPLTPNGKLDTRHLPPPELAADDTGYVAPRTELEIAMASIWSSVLGVERVGITDNFFALGGHSLNATQLVARLRDTLGTEFPLRTLFDQPTIAELVRHIAPAQDGAAPLQPRPATADVPLALPQQRLWFIEQLEPGSSVYVLSRAIRVRGSFSAAALQTAVDALLARHESLRTRFAATDNGPLQIVETDVQLPVSRSRLDTGDAAELGRALAAIAHQPFDLGCAPLFRVHLLEVNADERILAFAIHHIMSDNWSVQILMRDLLTLYQSALTGTAAALPELPLQYGDYAYWQRTRQTAAEMQRQHDYWLAQLADAPLVLELPADRQRPAVQQHRGDQVHWLLEDGTAERLRAVSAAAGCSPFMTLIAVYALLLSRYSGQDDLLIGTPIAGRPHSQLENLIGFFVNMLIIRADLTGNPSFSQLLTRIRATTLDAFAHQDLPFEKLIEALHPERDMSRSPVFQFAFILQNAPTPGADLGARLGEPVAVTHANSKFDMTLGMWETGNALGGSFEFDTDLFDRSTIEHLRDHFCTLLQAVAERPAAALAELGMLPAAERRQLLTDWNATQRDYPRCGISQRFAEQVRLHAQRPALTCAGQSLSYAELNQRANRLAHYLLAHEVGRETPVALCMERGLDAVISILAIIKAGGAYVPLDPTYPPQRLQFMLDDTASPLVLTHSTLAAALGGPNCVRINLDEAAAAIARCPDDDPPAHAAADQLAYIVYTSGSTGTPKGVLIEQRSVMALVVNSDFAPLERGLRIGMLAPISFYASTMEIWGALLNGGECVVFPDRVPELSTLRQFFAAHPLDLLFLTTGLFNTIVDADPGMLRQVGQLLTGGEAMSADHVRRAAAQLPDTQLANIYGPTESTTYATVHPLPPALPDMARIPIGRPLANTTVYILDAAGQPAAVGTPGELHIGGDGLARGYLGQPELTAERFIPHPFAAGERLYRTGDLARYRADGTIEFLGRRDTQVKLRGFRIELDEIASTLRQHASVSDAIAIVHEMSALDRRLVAYVVPASGSGLDVAELSDFLAQRLPDYMRPAALQLLPRLPLNANGKVDRQRLPQPEWQAVQRYTAPRNAVEQRLCALWQELLGVPRVGIEDDFFELGGHSLLTIKLLDRIEREFGQRLRVAQVFSRPTVAAVAELISTTAGSPAARATEPLPAGTLLPVRTSGRRPPLFCIHGEPLKMARALDSEQPLYGIYFSYDPHFRMPATVEGLARLYVDELRRVQPNGPYHIVGYCLGGLAAFEMARQLQADGETVNYLALIDPTNPELTITRREWLVRSFSIPGQRLNALRFFAGRAVRSLISRTQYVARIAATYGYELAGKEIPFLLREVRHTGKARASFGDYRYAQLPLAGVIFRPDLSAADAEKLQRYWETKFMAGANLIRVPGLKDHMQFMQEPFHTDVSKMIDVQLAQLHRQQGPHE